MKYLSCLVLLSSFVSLQASISCEQNTTLKLKDQYTWDEQFLESIEDGEDRVRDYVAMGASLTAIDPVTERTPLELAVLADNNVAVQTILDVAKEKNQDLAINMALTLTENTRNLEATAAMLLSSVKDDKL